MRYGSVYTISAERSFVDALADGLLEAWGTDPLMLSDAFVLLPTRRACRALREAFLRRAEGRALLLPRLRPIGDIDEEELGLSAAFGEAGVGGADLAAAVAAMPPPVGDLRRRLILTRLILEGGWGFEDPTPDQASLLAADLGRFLDQVQVEGLSLDNLERLVPEEFSENWQRVLAFLDLIRTHWPRILEEEQAQDPGQWQTALRRMQIEAWRENPPAFPVIAAGSTGTVPSTADLLSLVLTLPQGLVVLPGLDRQLDEPAWSAVADDQTHPQFGLAKLLTRFGTNRESVLNWPGGGMAGSESAARVSLLSEAMRPARASDGWRTLSGEDARRFSGVDLLTCPTPHTEATAIALIMRQALDTPRQRAALVTPDRGLARRVAGELKRWGLMVDDSAGLPLEKTPGAVFLRLLIETVSHKLSPVSLLALLKHPYAAGGERPSGFRATVRVLERHLLRGPKPGDGFAGLDAVLSDATFSRQADRDRVAALLARLRDILEPLLEAVAADRTTLGLVLDAHVRAAEALAATDTEAGSDRLWDGEDGEALARFVRDLTDSASADVAVLEPRFYPAFFDSLLAGRVVRPRYGAHPRLSIWGPLEARLQHVEVMILGGLNEGVWPPEPQTDAWMSRPMRTQFGLPAPERRVGLSAHDFSQVIGAEKVYLTRSEKTDGQPTVPSRWLSRLQVVLDATGQGEALRPSTPWMAWAEAVGRTGLPAEPCAPPAPKPPVKDRPKTLSVTRVELLMRDPYSIYAQSILGLKLLDPLEADPGAAERGNFIHQALEKFVHAHPFGPLPGDALRQLRSFGEEAFGSALGRPAVRAFWWPRFERVAEWFLDLEGRRRDGLENSVLEVKGRMRVGDHFVRATADRVDRMNGGGLVVIDYKTGGVPTLKAIQAGYAPQLPLEAAIAMDAEDGFAEVAAGPVEELAFWQLSGGDPPGVVKPIPGDTIAPLAAAAREGAAQLFDVFDDPETPYLAVPRPAQAPRFNDYAHLARLAEWSVTDEGGE